MNDRNPSTVTRRGKTFAAASGHYELVTCNQFHYHTVTSTLPLTPSFTEGIWEDEHPLMTEGIAEEGYSLAEPVTPHWCAQNIMERALEVDDRLTGGELWLSFSVALRPLSLESKTRQPEFTTRPNQTIEETLEISKEFFPQFDIELDNDTLRTFYRNRKNIIDDSVNPDLIPHIVITPIEDTWEDRYNAWQNRIDPQLAGNLCIPPVDPLANRLDLDAIRPLFSPGVLEYHSIPAVDLESRLEKFPRYSNPTVFTFHRNVFAENYDNTIQKEKCKDVFFAACALAQTFCERYDLSPDLFSSVERPFVWTDPAESILLAIGCHFRATNLILHSSCPFRVPHVIISEPEPPSQFYPPDGNATPPQDQGHGLALIVPSPFVDIFNALELPLMCYSSPSEDDPIMHLSRPETPEPRTPSDAEDEDREVFLAQYDEAEQLQLGVTTSSAEGLEPPRDPRRFPKVDSHPMEVPGKDNKPRPIFSIEEGEDDLPPFDEWYTR